MSRFIAATGITVAFLSSCSSSLGPVDQPPHTELAQKRADIQWWRQLNDSSLNQDISSAFAKNPQLHEVALRVELADAAVAKAQASRLPHLNLGFGYTEGRRQEVDFGPYDIAPWRSRAGLSWEIDVTGKLRAAQKSASANREATVWDQHAARLLLANRIASSRIVLYRFNSEIQTTNQSLNAIKSVLAYLTERSQAGLIPDSLLDKRKAEIERIKRVKLELERLRDLTIVQLRTLRGGSSPSQTTKNTFPADLSFTRRPVNELIASHPSVLAAEARVRSAFQLENSARLDLLPSFQLNLLANGGQKSLVSRFMVWTAQAGPSLNIPIYDPSRLATLSSRRAEAKIAATKYRQTILTVLEEIDTARVNLASRRSQLAAAKRQTQALANSMKIAREQFEAGLSSQIEYLDYERQWLEAKRSKARLHQGMLEAQINLLISTGGGRL